MFRPTRAARAIAFVASVATFLLGGVVFAGVADAHHPEIEATWACDGTVTYTAFAWAGTTPEARTNPSIDVHWTEDQSDPVPADAWTHVVNGAFDETNSFQFTGTFSTTSTADTIGLLVTEGADWANGTPRRGPGQEDASQFVRISRPDGCEEQQPTIIEEPETDPPPPPTPPAATIADPTCIDGGAVVTLTNPSTEPVPFTITFGTTTQVELVAPLATAHVLVPVGITETRIAVTAPGLAEVARTFALTCTRPTAMPTATIADATCAEEGALVELANTGGAPVTFTLAGPMATVRRDVPAGGEGSEIVHLPNGSGTITVTAPGMATVSRAFVLQCVAVAGEVIERPAVVRPAPLQVATPSVAPAVQVLASPEELPRTGAASTETLLLVSFSLLLVGLALTLAPVVGRRRATDRTTRTTA